MKVAILAGGLGTRLGDLTRDLPKPMIAVGGRPFLAHVIESFSERGLRDFVLLTGRFADRIEEYFGDGSRFGVRIEYSREREPAGTGGALRQARTLLGERFLLTYGDVYRRFDYDRFVNDHPVACLAVYTLESGNTDVRDGKVVRFDKSASLPYVDAGFCVMPATVIDLLAPQGSFEQTVFPALASARELDCEIVDHDFVEIGTPEALERARVVLR
jgi:NDP-sugar pyrophosphorylase family protein